MKCPRFTDQEIIVITFEYDDNGNVIKETKVAQYSSMKCDKECSLFEFRPNCIRELK